MRRALANVGGAAGVVAGEAVAGAAELEQDWWDQKHADEDVRAKQLAEEGDRRPLGGKQNQQGRGDPARQAGVAGNPRTPLQLV